MAAEQPRALPGGGYGFLLPWEDVEPRGDAVWSIAGNRAQHRFRQEAARLAAEVWDAARAKGLDRHGKRLARLSPRTVKYRRSSMGPADPKAPPLTPAYDLSRTRSFLKRQVTAAGVWFWWKKDPRAKGPWGKIVWYHAMGMVRGAPVRDVMGFSQAELESIKRRLAMWWKAHRPQIVIAPSGLAVAGKPPVGLPAPRIVQTARGRILEGQGIRFNLDTATMGVGREGIFERAEFVGDFRNRRLNGPGGPGAAPPARPRPGPGRPGWIEPGSGRMDPMAVRAPGEGSNPARAFRAEAARYLEAQGIRVVRQGRSRIEKATSKARAINIAASYDPKSRLVYLNQGHAYWGRAAETMSRNFSRRWTSTDHRMHVAYQEEAHWRHHVAVGNSEYHRLRSQPLTPEQEQIARKDISEYASQSVGEFVAEVFAMLKARLEVTTRALALYNEFGGPNP